MESKALTSIEQWNELQKRYQHKDTLCNNFMMPAEVEGLINAGCLSVWGNEQNLFLLQKKAKCSRVYYYLNSLDEFCNIDIEDSLVLEILFRQDKGLPQSEIEYFSQNGYQMNKLRDQYSGTYKTMNAPSQINQVQIREANSLEEVKISCELFNRVFDNYSGDYITEEEIPILYDKGMIIVATDSNNNYLGALHQTIIKTTSWISHISVIEEARGKGVGKALLDTFVEYNKCEGRGRYMLWVQSQNTVAINMYQHKGFKSTGKSTISMIKKQKY